MILSINHKETHNHQLYVTDSSSLPEVEYTDSELSPDKVVLHSIFPECFELSPQAYIPKLLDIIVEDGNLNIVYRVMVPDFVELKSGKWVSMQELIKGGLDVEKYCKYIHKI